MSVRRTAIWIGLVLTLELVSCERPPREVGASSAPPPVPTPVGPVPGPQENLYLTAWVTHAQSLKPNAQMPDLTAFTGDDLRALVAYFYCCFL